jgi:hypothetical protein
MVAGGCKGAQDPHTIEVPPARCTLTKQYNIHNDTIREERVCVGLLLSVSTSTQ